jgi:hypothetical protein
MRFNNKETATLLAALRHFQDTTDKDERAAFDHFALEGIQPPSDKYIDTLCEAINFPGSYVDEIESIAKEENLAVWYWDVDDIANMVREEISRKRLKTLVKDLAEDDGVRERIGEQVAEYVSEYVNGEE